MSDAEASKDPQRKLMGAYRRAIRIKAQPGQVVTEMEDDVHHFRLRLQHSEGTAVSVEGEAVRTPWIICPGALAPLRALTGRSLDAGRRDQILPPLRSCRT